jgi:predicted neuraminidase
MKKYFTLFLCCVSIACFSQENTGASVARDFIFEDDRPFKECHASTLLRLDDGNYLVAWFGGTKEKDDDVGIWLSKGKPRHWSAPRQVAKIRHDAHWNPVLFGDGKGTVYLYFKVGKEIPAWETWVTVSNDEGATWTEPVELVQGDTGGRGPVRNKPILLSDGSWLAGASHEEGLWNVFVDRSEDNGKTWQSTPYLSLDRNGFNGKGVIQPTLWESAPGNVHMLVRSTNGMIYRSDSNDYGKTWSVLYATGMPNNNSGIDLVKLADGTLVLAYNPVSGNWASRASLNLAVSYDNGVTWPKKVVLENDSDRAEYSYPAIITHDNRVALTYTWKRQRIVLWEFAVDSLNSTQTEIHTN